MKKPFVILIFISLMFGVNAQYNKGVLLEPVLTTDTTSIGQKIVYPDFANNEVSILKVTIPPGISTGWHKHSFPVFGYVMQGTLTVETKNGKSNIFLPGSAFSEVIHTLHNGTNKGTDDVVLIAFFMGEKGKPLSEH
ncbi:MAG: cupin domain-containing protein [Paludibacter sp.]|nr:cupin domain-containing protein [Paludibacter sp.]